MMRAVSFAGKLVLMTLAAGFLSGCVSTGTGSFIQVNRLPANDQNVQRPTYGANGGYVNGSGSINAADDDIVRDAHDAMIRKIDEVVARNYQGTLCDEDEWDYEACATLLRSYTSYSPDNLQERRCHDVRATYHIKNQSRARYENGQWAVAHPSGGYSGTVTRCDQWQPSSGPRYQFN